MNVNFMNDFMQHESCSFIVSSGGFHRLFDSFKALTKSWRYSCLIFEDESSDKTPSHDFDGIMMWCIPC